MANEKDKDKGGDEKKGGLGWPIFLIAMIFIIPWIVMNVRRSRGTGDTRSGQERIGAVMNPNEANCLPQAATVAQSTFAPTKGTLQKGEKSASIDLLGRMILTKPYGVSVRYTVTYQIRTREFRCDKRNIWFVMDSNGVWCVCDNQELPFGLDADTAVIWGEESGIRFDVVPWAEGARALGIASRN